MVHQTECQSAAYLDDTYLTAVTTTVAATGRQDDGAAWVAVRRNVFHPQGRQEAAAHLLQWVTAKVADDLPVTVDHDAEGLRIVRLGDVHAAPCGGTHVRGLADLVEVAISAVKVKKGRVRVSYSAAHGPLR
ncbi:hypothetical protein [Nonomuraea roseola]|uniref:Threonyl/alanyl tRNA synthetase SAD domain-containing protein n=1 Tax=Nonomuraea roseola TaxID=46179 RepID=A0ABV5PRF1_9ACTN